MSDQPHPSDNPLGRLARHVTEGAERLGDRVEEAVERVRDHRTGDSAESERMHHRPVVHTAGHRGGPEITINVDVCCCCPGGKHRPGPTGTGRPGHVTGTSDGTLPGGITGVGGVIDVVTRPPNVWPGPRTQLFLP